MDLSIAERIAKFGSSDKISILELNRLKELVKNGENSTIEFKLKANHPEKIVREIVAFANTNGGKLLIGVDDSLQIKGLKFAEEEEYIIVNAINKYCFPKVNYSIAKTILPDNKEVLIFDIPKSKTKPHFVWLDRKSNEKITYVRVFDKSLQASKEVKKYLKGASDHINTKFQFGEKELKLMQYLDINKSITVKDFSKIAKIPLWVASKTLVILSLANVLKIIPGETADAFIRNIHN